MKRLILLLTLLVALPAAAENFCNNASKPCETDNILSHCYKPPQPDPVCEPKICGKCTKSPCYAGSGVYETSAHDLKIATTGFPIEIRRLYQTSQAIDGEMGYGWTSSLSARLYYTAFLKAAPSTYQRDAWIRMPDGSFYRFADDGNGGFTAPKGRFDTLVLNPDGTWDLWLQRMRSHYHFDAGGNLLQMIDDYGNTLTWTYTNDRVSRIEDTSGSGRYVDVTHGADGRISDVTDMTGRNVHYAYNGNGVLVSVTNPLSQVTAYAYGNGMHMPLLASVTDHWARNITSITYDAQDRVKTYTEKGETYTYTYGAGGGPVTTKADSGGNAWQYPSIAGGLVTGSQPPGGGGSEQVDYYPSGLVQLHTDPVGVKTHYTYDARGNPLTVTNDYQGPTAVQWRYVYDANFPDLAVTITPYNPSTNAVHPDWQARKFDYYPPGSTAPGALHHVHEVDNDGVTSRVVVTYTYDAGGRVLTRTGAAAETTTYTYDGNGNLATIESPANNDNGIEPVVSYTYDALGRRTGETDPDGNSGSTTFDLLDRPLTMTLPKPSGASTLTFTVTYHHDEYDSAAQLLFTRVIDANGRTTRYGKDVYDQLVRKEDPSGAVFRSVFVKGMLTSTIDANNNATAYAYDALRRLATITYPNGIWERYTYHADGQVATFRDRANQLQTFTYDRHKRLTGIAYSGGGNESWTYAGQKLMSMTSSQVVPAETHSYTYDASFRVISETQGTRGTFALTYASDGRIATESLAGGATKTLAFYPDGSLKTIAWSPVAGNFTFTYQLSGEVTSIVFPNGQTRNYTYDDQGRVTAVSNVHPSTGNLATHTYGYDLDAFNGQPNRLGLRTTVTATVPALGLAGAVTSLGYDVNGQLVRADYPAAAPYNGLASAWTYDAIGNRTSVTENGVTASYLYTKYNANPLNGTTLENDGGNAYTYDLKGNTLTRSGSRGNFTFGWDLENRLTSISGGISASYKYDPAGRRTSKTVSGVTTTYVYSEDHIVAESGASPAEYLHAPGVDQPLAMLRGGNVYYYDVDALGSVVALNDAAGAVVNSYAYDAWGTAVAQNETVTNPFVYTGREQGEAGLLHYRYRWFEPATSSFRSVDPLVTGSGLALAIGAVSQLSYFPEYRYVNNNPVTFVDPFGLGPCQKCGPDYDKLTRRCWIAYNVAVGVCFGRGIPKGRAILKGARGGIIEWIVCITAADSGLKWCLKWAAEDYEDCIKDCMCKTPPPPPPPPPPATWPGKQPPPPVMWK
ncbi:MAG TPA: RHS repeat-associated core domain-containing protein [Thermoanaerobaculia bacterium]